MPMGESRAQVADRVKGVFGTILRDADPNRDDPVQNFIIVSHGVTIRAFILQWMHFNFEWYGRQTNPNNCSVNLITSTGEAPYEHRLIYPGFVHNRRSEEHTSELQSLMRNSYAVFCLKKKTYIHIRKPTQRHSQYITSTLPQ